MTHLLPARRRSPLRATAIVMAATLALSACAAPGTGGGVNEANLTPEQRTLRQQSSNWNQTVATGALAGAALGAGAGALLNSRNRATGALVGGGVGLLGGLAAGAMVANRNLAFEDREMTASQRIESARQVAANLNAAAASSERVTEQNRAKLAQLDRQYRAGQITSAQYRGEADVMRQDVELMRKTATEARDARTRLVASSGEVPRLMSEESKIDTAQRRLEVSAGDLETALRKVPAT